MTETYSLHKNIPGLGIDIDIEVIDKQLLLKLDEIIFDTIVEHYHLTNPKKELQK